MVYFKFYNRLAPPGLKPISTNNKLSFNSIVDYPKGGAEVYHPRQGVSAFNSIVDYHKFPRLHRSSPQLTFNSIVDYLQHLYNNSCKRFERFQFYIRLSLVAPILKLKRISFFQFYIRLSGLSWRWLMSASVVLSILY